MDASFDAHILNCVFVLLFFFVFRTGRRLESRDGETCVFSEKEEPYQCYGLGKKQEEANSKEECQELCCKQTERCELWQWRDDKGRIKNISLHKIETRAVKFYRC